MMTSLIWWAKCCHPYLWLQFPILISALNVWLSISIFKIKIDKLASQNQNSIFKIMLWVVNIKIQIQDSKVAYQDWYSTSTFASLLGNIQYQNQNCSRHQIQHQFQEYCQYQHQNQPISIILPTSVWPHTTIYVNQSKASFLCYWIPLQHFTYLNQEYIEAFLNVAYMQIRESVTLK